jgi:hypothetical protein
MSFSRTVVHVLVFWRGARGRQRVRTWALDVADDGTGLVVHELDTALGDTTTGACNISVSLPFSQVTLHPPRFFDFFFFFFLWGDSEISRTGSAKDTGDLDEVDGGLSRVHFVRL